MEGCFDISSIEPIEDRVFMNPWNCRRATIPAFVLFNYRCFLEVGRAILNPFKTFFQQRNTASTHSKKSSKTTFS